MKRLLCRTLGHRWSRVGAGDVFAWMLPEWPNASRCKRCMSVASCPETHSPIDFWFSSWTMVVHGLALGVLLALVVKTSSMRIFILGLWALSITRLWIWLEDRRAQRIVEAKPPEPPTIRTWLYHDILFEGPASHSLSVGDALTCTVTNPDEEFRARILSIRPHGEGTVRIHARRIPDEVCAVPDVEC